MRQLRQVYCEHVGGYCADGKLVFDGLVASPDGSKVFKTSRSGEWSEESVLRLGREAGEELKAEAGPEFFTWLQ